jgi:hypothetical protein
MTEDGRWTLPEEEEEDCNTKRQFKNIIVCKCFDTCIV